MTTRQEDSGADAPRRRHTIEYLASVLVLGATLWVCAALWIDGPRTVAVGFPVVAAAILIWIRPFRRGLLVVTGSCVAAIVWWQTIEPSNDRDWLPDVAQLPTASIEGDHVTVRNVRNFDYRSETDFEEHWEERSYDLSKLEGVDLFLSYWGSPWIAHTIVSWEFENDRHLAISIETRKERGEEYSAVLGFFRQFELYYVVADERDVVGIRTGYRGEEVYMYRLVTPIETARSVLIDYLEAINRLAAKPKWYNAATHNCTTMIQHHMENVAAANPWDWRMFVNGRLDELAYQRGRLDTTIPFPDLRQRSNVSDRGRDAGAASDFSRRIRDGLPRRQRELRPAISSPGLESSR